MIRLNQHETARAGGAAPATPPGGAQEIGGRGCGFVDQFPFVSDLFSALAVRVLALAVVVGPACADETGFSNELVPVAVPSGQQVLLSEVLLDDSPGALWARFRFVAPKISRSDDTAKAMDFQRSAGDMDYLCDSLALDYLRQHDLAPSMVVISFSDRPVEFGQQDPDATQFFEAYRPDEERCIWEAF